MQLTLSEQQTQFRKEVHDFLAANWRPSEIGGVGGFGDEGSHERELAFKQKLAEFGWLGVAIPTEHGGSGKTPMEQFLFVEEVTYYGAPHSYIGVGFVAPTLIRYGTEEQLSRFLPPLVRGEIEFCLGYSEPDAGSDLAALKTSVVEDGDDLVINGSKIYTTNAHRVEYCWLAARSDPTVPKHKGISLVIVPMDAPGVTVAPLMTAGGERTNQVFFDSVRVPKANLVGEKNRGWYYLAVALDFERFNGFPLGAVRRSFDELVEAVQEGTTEDGRPLKEQAWVREIIGRLATRLDATMTHKLNTVAMAERGEVPNTEASMLKVMASDLAQEIAYGANEIFGERALIKHGQPGAIAGGRFEHALRSTVLQRFAGGTNEIMKNIIAQRGLGLPRD
jgi:alkylation response protein AidB-like acyl-CoA dehydrogenase